MKVHYECLSCQINQCQKIAELSTNDLEKRKEAMIFSAKLFAKYFNEKSIPAIVGSDIFLELYEYLGVDDPFKEYKDKSNKLAQKVVENLKKKLEIDLRTALKLAIAGNVIDFAVGYEPEKIEEDILEMLKEELHIDESEKLFEKLRRAKILLYLTDNCGEIYFDKLLLEKIKEEFPELTIYIAGKKGAIINDATVNDLKEAKLDEVGKVISTGTRIVGVPIGRVSKRFLEIFDKADVIIAKGQGNFETLSEIKDNRVFFLLKAKCKPVARELSVPQGAMVCKTL
ncbi:DUF89 domain-containing protein [Thermococcus sp. M39]|uniref:damage-control phosphatase n=1 Tax=unclassified Thermococcus TaxID=2627626 RepID=UPI00143C7DB8|nr:MULTISPECIES: damage-control phosphatase [unclassified Thermococcus]NJE07351.1 DUF89 domain-containing protein [Thermococcus sp. M39]NJE12518.1 DUF89 domain-containing protein [Thermococcus sp. LS2]